VTGVVDREGLLAVAGRDVADVDQVRDSGDVVLVTVGDEQVPDREDLLAESRGNALPRVE